MVVSSILIAFVLEAWWDYRQDRRDEAELGAGLVTEFESNRERIAEDIEVVRGYTEPGPDSVLAAIHWFFGTPVPKAADSPAA